MSSKFVATEYGSAPFVDMISATASDGDAKGTDPGTGEWIASVPTIINKCSKLSVDSKFALISCSCVFTYVGTLSGSPVTIIETVNLSSSTTKLKCGSQNLLLVGDSKEGLLGMTTQNELKIVSGQTKLKSA